MKILLLSLLACLVVALPLASSQKVKWCVTTQNQLEKCKHLAKATELDCHQYSSITECMKSIKTGEMDAVTVDGEHVYLGGLVNYKLRPIIAEKYKEGGCYAVAVVKSDSDFSIKDLKGKTSCHSCFQSAEGWNLPIGNLVKSGILPFESDRLVKAVSQFFSHGCVPGISKNTYPELCKSCQGDCTCSRNEQCSGSEGAFRCMMNNNCQVAFMCHKEIPANDKQNVKLLCMDGSRRSVDDYENCHFGKEPGRAVISRMDADSNHIYEVLQKIPASDKFSSQAYGGKDLIFSDSAFDLMKLPKNMDSFLYLKGDYFETLAALRGGKLEDPASDRKIQWCTVGHAEQQKCDSLQQIPRLECRTESSVDDCIKKIMRKEADAITVDGGQVYIAGKCGLVPVMVEQNNERKEEFCSQGGVVSAETASYYVVAVVRKGSGVTWDNLKGKKSCHTGLNRNAGWKVPDAVICGSNPDCTLYNFFSKGCAPGADLQSNMCELCKGSGRTLGDSKCKATSTEMYYGYDGAFRCLAEKAGDVAFVKHTVIGDYTNGNGPEWAKDLKSDDFELICPTSKSKTESFTNFKNCHLTAVPAHAVITREDARNDVVSFLNEAQAINKELFRSENGKNLLFTDTTKCLQENKQPMETFMGTDYMDVIKKTYRNSTEPDLLKACTLDNYTVKRSEKTG
ncbi:hypothetical protein DNTS_029396 [Danionella cerebrum]|uniref:Serotransferrin n=1 Tax=Danionella cerebrum TaxID=2873325 RepID=A0A553QV80_9TELE|nr:hypothetical protein DNTS_029396 [Danionella translucida]